MELSEGGALGLYLPESVQVFEGAAMGSEALFHARLLGDGALEGLHVEISGTALGCLEVEALEVWVPYGESNERRLVSPEQSAGGLIFELSETTLRGQGEALEAVEAATLGAAEIEARLLEENRRSLAGCLVGRGLSVGDGELSIRVSGEGTLAEESTLLVVDPRPRIPALPRGGDALDVSDPHVLALCDLHDGADELWAWFAFSSPRWLHEGDGWTFVDLLIQAALETLEAEALDVTLTSPGGGPPRQRRRGLPAVGREGLEGEQHDETRASLTGGGALRLEDFGAAPGQGGRIWLRNATLGDPLAAAALPAFPLEVGLSLPQPEADATCARLISATLAFLDAAIHRDDCVGALATAQGGVAEPSYPLPYELLAELPSSREALGARPRSPGWRVLVPSAREHLIGTAASVRRRPAATGTLVGSAAPDPFSMDDDERRALEEVLLPCFAHAPT